MKRLNRLLASTVLLLSAALFSSPAAAQIAFVKTIGTTQTTSTGTSTTITVPATGVAVGNSVIVALAMDPASGAVSCSDTQGNGYTSNRDVTNGAGTSGVRTVVLSAHNIIALTSGNTISCTHPSLTARALSANEFSGLASTSTVDVAASATGNSTSPSSGNTTTTTQASELLIGGIGVEGPSDDSFTAGTNYTAIGRVGTIGGSAANNITVNPEYRIVSATSAYAATGSLFRTTRQWSAAIVTYKAAVSIATKLAITSINGGSNPTAGVSFPVVVQSQNASGSPTNVISATAISLTLKTGTGILGGTLTGTIAAGANQVTITGVTYTKAESGVAITATRTSGDSLTAGDSAPFTVVPGAATKVAFSTQPGNSTAGSPLSGPPTVVVQDGLGNTVTSSTASITVRIVNNPGGGTLSGTTFKNAAAGVASFNDLSIDKAGTGYTLLAVANFLTSATSSGFNITAAAATKLVFSVQPTNTIAGTAIGTPPNLPPTVIVQDNFGNTVMSSTASITVAIGTNPGGGTLSGTTPKNASGGVASFSDLSIDKSGTGYTVTVSATGLTSATSSAFNITAAAAAKVAFTTQPGNANAGTTIPGPPTVTVQDSFGNTVLTSTASITIGIGTNPGGGALSGTTAKNAVSGVVSFTDLSINQAGNGYTLAVSSAGLTGATSNGFNITSGSGGGTIAGVITRVSNGSAITGALVEAYQGTALLGSAVTNSSGSYSITGLSTGTYTVRASFTGLVPQTLNNVSVASGSTTTVDLSLNFGIAVQSPVAGAVVNDFSVLVKGNFNTSLAPEVGIQVNGYVALQDGNEFAALVPIDSQTTTVTATITDSAGNLIAGDAVPITPQLPNAAPLLFFRPSPAIALVTQPVSFTLTSVNPVTQIQLDGNGDGTIDYTGSTLQGVAVTFATSGLYFPTVSVTEQGGTVRTATTIVQVFDSSQLDTLLQNKWTAMKNALRLGDVSGVVSHIVLRRRATYQAMFNALTVPLANIDQVLTSVTYLEQRGIEAEYEMMVNEGGVQHSYMVLFEIDEDGVWRVKFF